MTAYEVTVNVSIKPKDDGSQSGDLWFYRRFTLTGESFSDIAKRIDALYAAIGEGLAGEM
jgi:hypothetical protein